MTVPAVIAASAVLLLLPGILMASPLILQDVLANWQNSPYARYPTDFTRGIIPKPIHSHNDYWRPTPLYSAIANGAISVEADVWLYNETLYVGHEEAALTENRTFETLYIDPLVSILDGQNPNSRFVSSQASKNGVYDTSSGQTLYLWVDLKTPGAKTMPYVIRALEPLRSKGYLTKLLSNGTLVPGAITVIGTGNTPASSVKPVLERDYFIDGPLLELVEKGYTKEISPIASTRFTTAVGVVTDEAGMNETQVEAVRAQVQKARELGILARYWDTPLWPVRTRNAVWRQLYELGVGLVNVDDLEAAAGEEW